MENFHPVAYAADPTDPNTPILHEVMRGLYREGFIDATDGDIDALY